MTQITSSIEQINLGYNQQEDRLLLKVGMKDKTEVVLWLTRRVSKDIWNLLQNSHGQVTSSIAAAAPSQPLPAPKLVSRALDKAQALADFSQEIAQHQSLEVMDFTTEYIADRQALSDAPVLVLQCNLLTTQSQTTNLEFRVEHAQTIKMGLTLELVIALTNMMQLATREAGWDLLMLQHSANLHLGTSEHVLH